VALPKALKRPLARKGKATAVATVRFAQVDGSTATVRRQITLVRPQR
jgi:hypothetical protein